MHRRCVGTDGFACARTRKCVCACVWMLMGGACVRVCVGLGLVSASQWLQHVSLTLTLAADVASLLRGNSSVCIAGVWCGSGWVRVCTYA